MKITIIGAGAMGCLFGGLLSEHGMVVHLIDVREKQVTALNDNGLTIFHQGIERVVRVRAVTEPAAIHGTDLVVIFVKHAQTEAAARTAAFLLGNKGCALTLQNGMGNAEIIADVLGRDRVLCGTTAQGSMVLDSGKIQHSGTGETIIGMWRRQGEEEVTRQLAEVFTEAGIICRAVDDIEPFLWKKLFVNVGINAITALTGLRNGQLLNLKASRLLMQDVVSEAMAVAEAHSIEVPPDILEHVEQVAKATASNRSSMGQDVDGQRVTEIDAINGYIVRKAQEVGIVAPVNQTLVRLVQTVQEGYTAAS